jgi:[acyl-carrier-protein] S-malonyltransferase
MAAVIGGDEAALASLCEEIGGVAPANVNAPGQIVVSGTDEALQALSERAKEIGARRVLRLNVAGPFHSPAMAPAAEAVSAALGGTEFREASVPVYTNVTAKPQSSASELSRMLVEQVTGRVLWADTIRNMVGDGITDFVEMGPGTVLAGLMKRIAPDDMASLNAFLEVAGQ